MNRNQILEILQTVRSREEGEGDPLIEEAFDRAAQDSELKKILIQEREWDAAVKKSITAISVPSDLKQRILNQCTSKKEAPSNILSFPKSWWIPLAAAALLIFSFGILNVKREGEPKNFARFEEEAVGYTQGFFMLSKNTPQLAEAREWLKSRGTPHAFQIPFRIEGMSQFGCKQVEFCGIRSSMICFEVEGIKKEVHLFVIDKNDIQNLPSFGIPEFHEKKGNAVAQWTDDKHGYILTGEITLDEMRSLF